MSETGPERMRQALELRLAGATYEAISTQLGYAGPSGAHKAVQTALASRMNEQAPDVVQTEVARLDALLTGLWAKARRGDVQAVDRVLRISERRMQLLASVPAEKSTSEVSPVDELLARRDARRSASQAQ